MAEKEKKANEASIEKEKKAIEAHIEKEKKTIEASIKLHAKLHAWRFISDYISSQIQYLNSQLKETRGKINKIIDRSPFGESREELANRAILTGISQELINSLSAWERLRVSLIGLGVFESAQTHVYSGTIPPQPEGRIMAPKIDRAAALDAAQRRYYDQEIHNLQRQSAHLTEVIRQKEELLKDMGGWIERKFTELYNEPLYVVAPKFPDKGEQG